MTSGFSYLSLKNVGFCSIKQLTHLSLNSKLSLLCYGQQLKLLNFFNFQAVAFF